jgi:hypothetical protein
LLDTPILDLSVYILYFERFFDHIFCLEEKKRNPCTLEEAVHERPAESV